jgi:hypothetical protein
MLTHPKSRRILLLSVGALLAICLPTASQTVLLDNFSSGTDANWTHLDYLAPPSGPFPPSTFDASSGAYLIQSAIPLPPLPVVALTGSAWTQSLTDPQFSQGFLRAIIRVNTTATNIAIGMRLNPSNVSGYNCALNNNEDRASITRVDPGAVAYFPTQVFIPFPINENVDYAVEAGAVGSTVTLKVWVAGSPEPAVPQLTLVDGVYPTGAIALGIYNQPTVSPFIPPGVGGQLSATFDDVYFRCPGLTLAMTQPGGPGTGVLAVNGGLAPGAQYFNLFSLDLCPAGPGTGPWLGLCYLNLATLLGQLNLPLGSLPFHFQAAGTTASFGPFRAPPGLGVEGVSFEIGANGQIGCISPAVRYIVQ